MDVTAREQPLPGIGHRYDLDLGDGRTLFVVVQLDGPRLLGVTEQGADQPLSRVPLTEQHAGVVAALLSGARFRVEPAGDEDRA